MGSDDSTHVEKINGVIKGYNEYAPTIILTAFFTVVIWIASQTLINIAVTTYLPGVQTYQVAIVEIFLGSFGLWFLSQNGIEKINEKLKEMHAKRKTAISRGRSDLKANLTSINEEVIGIVKKETDDGKPQV